MLAVTIAAAPLVLGGCTANRESATGSAKGHAAPPELAVTPGDKTRDVPVSAEVGTVVKGGRVTGVRLTDDKGKQVNAEPREDGSGWVPSAPLQPRRTYTAEVTAAA